ncbi:MAG: glycoside hydrolase family 3 C-terminal domain-containing protein [Dysgonamonadaceae bacterium]|jgi:beta-glucosidase|nr:glycoside hydrolase family 3 C-terminal domain-containing protein [Dysgonamonadaceae bacterium]
MNKKRICIYLNFIVIILFTASCNKTPAYKDASLPVEKRISDLLSRMTPEEKAAQLDMLSANDILIDPETLSPEQVHFFIDSMNMGAIHDFYPKSAALANQLQKHSIENSRLGIPILFIEEALHGYQGAGATTFPIPQGNASTWDTTLIYKIGRAIASEARAHGVHFVLGPNLDLAREIRWGRVEETFGEDVYLTSRMGVNLIKGLQGNRLSDDNAVAAEPKHFAIHGSPENGSNEGPVYTGEREARATGLYVFEKAVKEANAQGIMAAYHEMDGVPTVANHWLLTDILRNEWGFDGFVVTDLGAVKKQITTHYTANNAEEAILNALSAGLDMQFYDFPHNEFQQTIANAAKKDKQVRKDLDRAVKGILRVKFLLGLFDNPYTDETLAEKTMHNAEHRALALEAARQSIVLLQNENDLLPLSSPKRITLTGNLANSKYTGGYSPAGAEAISVYEALKERSSGKFTLDYINSEVSDRFSAILPDFMSPTVNSSESGLKVEFFNNPELSGQPAYTAIDDNLNPYWHNLSPAPGINPDGFSARWSGYITVPAAGVYEIDFRAANYGRLFINGKLLLDHWNEEWKDRGEKVQIRLEAGKKIPFRIEYAKTDGNAGVWLKWRLTQVNSLSLYADITRSAQKSDAVIVVMGESREEVGESRDKSDLNPQAMDMEIVKAAAKAGKPVITVMLTGRPLILTQVCELSQALLQCWFPGEATGTAICDVLWGDYNPSGRLTITFPKAQGHLPMYYSRKPSSHRRYVEGLAEPLFPFGYGLSYSRFEYKNLSITPENPTTNESVTLSLDVTNTGNVDGTETVQLYINDRVSSIETPVMELKGFAKVFLKAGETKKVTLSLSPEHFSLINKEMKRTVEPGDFEMMIGSSSRDIRLQQIITVGDHLRVRP